MAKKPKGFRITVRTQGVDYKIVTKMKNNVLQKLRAYALRYYKTGALFRSMRARTRKTDFGYDVIFEAKVEHAVYLQLGTIPHLIRNAFGRKGLIVHHPGSRKHVGWMTDVVTSVFDYAQIIEQKVI